MTPSLQDGGKLIIHLVAGARPNFMKIAPLFHELCRQSWSDARIIHTGQHYDLNMSDVFFRDLMLPEPHVNLNVGSGTHAKQTAQVLSAYEDVLIREKPGLVVVVGDVNSTMAATIAATKLGIPVAHLEAGLRSRDRTMPEEINRLVTDALADVLWTPSPDADENLRREGVEEGKIRFVGNIMIDSLLMLKAPIEAQKAYADFGLEKGKYCVVTLHRPVNVDHPDTLETICATLMQAARKRPVLFPVHPRTRKNLEAFGLLKTLESAEGVILTDPLNYIQFMNVVFNCMFVITDSGGIQEETTFLRIPCLTLRPNTERPVTVTEGTNQLCTPERLDEITGKVLSGDFKKGSVPALWDGDTAKRIVEDIRRSFL